MKKLFTLIVAALVSAAAFATEPGEGSKSTGVAIMKKNDNTFSLYYRAEEASDVKVSILSPSGSELFSETLKKTDGFVRPYSLNQLQPGSYTVKVVDGSETYTKSFEYTLPQVLKIARVAKIEDGKFVVAIPSGYTKSAQIKIYNGDELAFSKLVNTTESFGELFNVQQLKDAVTIEVIDQDGNKIN